MLILSGCITIESAPQRSDAAPMSSASAVLLSQDAGEKLFDEETERPADEQELEEDGEIVDLSRGAEGTAFARGVPEFSAMLVAWVVNMEAKSVVFAERNSVGSATAEGTGVLEQPDDKDYAVLTWDGASLLGGENIEGVASTDRVFLTDTELTVADIGRETASTDVDAVTAELTLKCLKAGE